MNNKTNENIEELFSRFLEGEDARQAADDIRKGEQILRDNPAPEPDYILIENIKRQMAQKSARQTRAVGLHRVIYRAAAVAAAIIIVLGISQKISDNGGRIDIGDPPIVKVKETQWDREVASMNASISLLSEEIEQSQNALLGISSTTGINLINSADELETDLIEIASDFWKG